MLVRERCRKLLGGHAEGEFGHLDVLEMMKRFEEVVGEEVAVREAVTVSTNGPLVMGSFGCSFLAVIVTRPMKKG